MIRVLIADDSPLMRKALVAVLASAPDLEVVGQAAGGREAIALAVRLRPDVITMDVEMPGVDGVAAVREIMTEAPSRIVVVSGVSSADRQARAYAALEAGALELVAKPGPDVPGGADLAAWGRKVIESIRLMAKIPVIRRARVSTPAGAESAAALPAGRVGAFGIAASTGGPQALKELLAALPAELDYPVLVAQHMTPGFTAGLVKMLAPCTRLKVLSADDGARCLPGAVYFPPDGHDLTLAAGGVLRVQPGRGPHVPSGDRLLSSIAACHGARAAGAVLTGMGDDGAAGLLAIRRAGGVTLAQDAQSSVVFGMPRAAFEKGATAELRPLGAIAATMRALGSRG